MEIQVDPKNEKSFKLIKRPASLLWVVILVIFVAGVAFALVAKNLLIFAPFIVILGLVYIFSGNSFEIGIDYEDKTIYRKSKDMLSIMEFYNRVKFDEIQKICIARQFSGDRHVADRLVLHLKGETRTALCSVSYEPDYDLLLRFSRGLAQVLDKEFESYPDYK
jgi:hypothetical protein